MTVPPGSRPERGRDPTQQIEMWIPQELFLRLKMLAESKKISPNVFLRKALELHANHRSENPVAYRYYADQSELQIAYGKFMSDPEMMHYFEEDLKAYQAELDEAMSARGRGQDPRDRNFTTAKVDITQDIGFHIDSYLSSEPVTAGYYVTPQAFGVAATLELMYIYALLEMPPNPDLT